MGGVIHMFIINGIEQYALPMGVEYEIERTTVTLERPMFGLHRGDPVLVFRYHMVAV